MDVPMDIYISTSRDTFRKPETGMWDFFLNKHQEVDKKLSFYVGDAAGRPKDFSDSDLKFAENIGLAFFTPEDYFTSETLSLNDPKEAASISPQNDSLVIGRNPRIKRNSDDKTGLS
eukprot:g2469.t1